MGLFRKKENIIVSDFSDNDSYMTMSEYEKLKEEHDEKVKNGEVTDELIRPRRIGLDTPYIRRKQQELLNEEIAKTGLCFNYTYYDSVLLDLLRYTKDNYDEAKRLFNKIMEIKVNERFPELNQAIFQNSNNLLEIINGNRIREKYIKFFDKVGGSAKLDLWNNLDRYSVLMFDIFDKLDDKNLDERNQYLDKVIFNFNKVFELGIKNVYIKLLSGDFHENIFLDGHPRGINKFLFPFGHLYYKEENFFTDGKVEDSYNGEYVDVDIENPSFIIKNGRRIGCQFASDEDFDNKYFTITVYDLAFDGNKLPSKEELENTKSDLATYDYMMSVKKLQKLKEQLQNLKTELNNTYSLMKKLGVDGTDFKDFFSSEENSLLDIAQKTGKVLTKRRD